MSRGDKTFIVFFILWILLLLVNLQLDNYALSFLVTTGAVFFGFVASIIVPFYTIMPLGRWLKKKFSKPKNNP
jgi:hypothetical protein